MKEIVRIPDSLDYGSSYLVTRAPSMAVSIIRAYIFNHKGALSLSRIV